MQQEIKFVSDVTYRGTSLKGVKATLMSEPKIRSRGLFGNFRIPAHQNPVRVYLTSTDDYVVLKTNADPANSNQEETEDQIIERTRKRFNAMRLGLKSVLNQGINGMIISGAAGIGKSQLVIDVFDAAVYQDPNRYSYKIVKGNITSAFQLYQLLYENKESGNVLVLDDCDNVLHDITCLNLLKAALETGSNRRVITYRSRAIEQSAVPEEFEFEGSVVFISNQNFQKIIDKNDSKLSQHFTALTDRTFYMDLLLHTRKEVFCRIKQMTLEGGLLDDFHFSDEMVAQFLFWLNDHKDQVRSLSLRTMLHIAELYMNEPEEWKELASAFLLKNQ